MSILINIIDKTEFSIYDLAIEVRFVKTNKNFMLFRLS